jgi:hypothetical protein
MKFFVEKLSLLLLAGLSAFFGFLITVFSLFAPCYGGCTVSSYFIDVIEDLPISLFSVGFLLCAGLLYVLALYLFLSIFTRRLLVRRWMYVLLGFAVTPMLLLALYGLLFDFGDAIIYGPLALIAITIVALIWHSALKKKK